VSRVEPRVARSDNRVFLLGTDGDFSARQCVQTASCLIGTVHVLLPHELSGRSGRLTDSSPPDKTSAEVKKSGPVLSLVYTSFLKYLTNSLKKAL
jgi:hypothetical protein